MSYLDVLRDGREVGRKVAIIGAGGIGFDTAEFLTQDGPSASLDPAAFMHEWGVDMTLAQPGGLAAEGAQPLSQCA
ncbi:hypothetical protein [Paludibacterium denitrificans]|uniref:hypothetical protein n=1 Tax=Paludibacterium denitrificans TaxID=2675226 RepID=UPI002477D465|nr:hypothetical protein [Paludibacterium denitrificans]